VPQLRIVQPELVVHAVLAWHVTEEAVPEKPAAHETVRVEP